jgi:hypothetical protein
MTSLRYGVGMSVRSTTRGREFATAGADADNPSSKLELGNPRLHTLFVI